MTKTTNEQKPSVLLVEDAPAQAMRFISVLETNGYDVRWVENGYDGLDAAKKSYFDFILLDIELPDINGFEVCQQLKADSTLADIPVIMLTTRDEAEDAMIGLESGALDYIPKDSFAEVVLIETLKQMRQLQD